MSPEETLTSIEAVLTDFFYWMSIALMICIHAGFLAYEMGASRSKNVLAAAMKNLLTFAVVIATFFFFGWWFYNAFYQFPVGALDSATAALPAICSGAGRLGGSSSIGACRSQRC